MFDSALQKLQKPARPQGVRGLQVFCIIFLLGNLIFFSTGLFLPKHYKDVEISPIGTELELGDYTLTLDSWDWAEKDRAFEIIFDVKDLSLDREPEYTFRFRCGDSRYRYKIYRDLGDLLVVRVSGVVRSFAQVSMTVSVDGTSKSIYMDDRSMASVEHLTDRSDAAYRIRAVEGKIAGYQGSIEKLEQQKTANIRTMADKQSRLQSELEDIVLQQQALQAQLEQEQQLLLRLQEGGDGQ